MKRTTNQDGSTSYTLSQTEKALILGMLAYLWGRRTGFYAGRSSMLNEIEKNQKPQP